MTIEFGVCWFFRTILGYSQEGAERGFGNKDQQFFEYISSI